MMRWIIDGLIVLMFAGIATGVVLHLRDQQADRQNHSDVRQALVQMREQVFLRAGSDPDADLEDLYPRQIEPHWFTALPRNTLASSVHPWLDVAPHNDLGAHPPDPVLDSTEQAGFWYSPARGIVRARVPRQYTDEQTLALYNQINDTALAVLPDGIDDLARRVVGVVEAHHADQQEEQPIILDEPPSNTLARPSLRSD